METVLASLGIGTRYCLVSDDHDRPELYADDHDREPQTLLERCTDASTRHEKFSKLGSSGSKLSSSGGGRQGLLGRFREERLRPGRRERLGKDLGEEVEKENAGPRREEVVRGGDTRREKEVGGVRGGDSGGLGLFERLTAARRGEGGLTVPTLGGTRPGYRSDQGNAPLMTGGDTGGDSWGWNSSPSKPATGDAQWGSGAAWEDAQLTAPKTKAAKAAKATKKAAGGGGGGGGGGSDQASLIDLGGESKEDDWQSWEEDAWASLSRK